MKFLLALLMAAPLAVVADYSDPLVEGIESCFNMTVPTNYGDRPEPWDATGMWGGEVCLTMLGGGQLQVDMSPFWYNSMYENRVFVGTSIDDMPLDAEGKPDLEQLPGQSEEILDGGSYSTVVPYDASACDLIVATYQHFGEPCENEEIREQGILFNAETDYPAWSQDLEHPNGNDDYSYLSFFLNAECAHLNPAPPREETDPPKEEPRTPGLPPGAGGDPHFKTWTGDKFDYHGECDLELIDNPTFHNGQGLKLHIRTTRVDYYSYIERIAVQIGDDVLEFANDVENFWINGKLVGKKQKHKETLLGGFIVRRDTTALSIRLSGDYNHRDAIAKIDLHARQNGFPGVVVDGGKTNVFEGSLGLLGDWSTGLKLARDGKTELNEEDATNFALEWQVRDTTLFQDVRFPQYPTQCTPPAKMMGNRLGLSNMKKQAEQVCANFKGDKEDCIFDVIATRSTKAASTE